MPLVSSPAVPAPPRSGPASSTSCEATGEDFSPLADGTRTLPLAPPPWKWDATDPDAVSRVKQVLDVSFVPAALGAALCRVRERERVHGFAREALNARRSAAMCISGVPGTGKSLTLRDLAEEAKGWENKPVVAFVNCFTLDSPRAVFSSIIEQMMAGGSGCAAGLSRRRSSATAEGENNGDDLQDAAALRCLLTRPPVKRKHGAPSEGDWTLVILDEIDSLASSAQGAPRFPGVARHA